MPSFYWSLDLNILPMMAKFEKFAYFSILGLSPCDVLAAEAVVPQGWSEEAANSPHSASFVSSEATTQTQQPTTGKLIKTQFITSRL